MDYDHLDPEGSLMDVSILVCAMVVSLHFDNHSVYRQR